MTQTTSPAPTPSNAFGERFRDLGSLRRSSGHRAVAGVAEGLSRHFDIDPIIVRVLFAALTFFGGAGLILYLALWLTVPRDTTGQSVISHRLNRDPRAWTTIGLATGGIFAGAALLGSLSWAAPRPFPFLLCALIVVLGLLLLTRRGERALPPGPPTANQPPTDPPSTPSPSVPPPSATSWFPASSGAPTTTEPTPEVGTELTAVMGTEVAAAPVAERAPSTIVNPYGGATADAPKESIPADTRAWWQRDDLPPTGNPIPPFAVHPPPPPRRPRSHLFGLTMASIALAEAVLWIVDATTGLDPNPSVYPGTALGIIAAALLAGTWWGRSRGLIAMGILASLLTAGAAFAGPGPYGDEGATPHQAGALHSSYRMGIGRFTLDLEQVSDIQALQGREVTVNQRFGQLRVVIPSSVAVIVDATVDHGSIEGPPEVQSLDQGGGHVVLAPDPDGRPTVTLHLNVEYGNIRIQRAVCPGDGPAAAGETTYIWREGSSYVPAACN